jgi:hypothetical protein
MMQRELQDQEGTNWTCVQAYSGLHQSQENQEAAKLNASENHVRVVCTPNGGARSIRIELPEDWFENLSDEQLLIRIKTSSASD